MWAWYDTYFSDVTLLTPDSGDPAVIITRVKRSYKQMNKDPAFWEISIVPVLTWFTVWPSGNGANAQEKDMAIHMADTFIDQMKYPRMKTQVLMRSCSHTSCKMLQSLLSLLRPLWQQPVTILNDHLHVWITTSTVASLCIQQAVSVYVPCAAGGDSATGEGDHHLQAVLQELELNISWECSTSPALEQKLHIQRLIQDTFQFFFFL